MDFLTGETLRTRKKNPRSLADDFPSLTQLSAGKKKAPDCHSADILSSNLLIFDSNTFFPSSSVLVVNSFTPLLFRSCSDLPLAAWPGRPAPSRLPLPFHRLACLCDKSHRAALWQHYNTQPCEHNTAKSQDFTALNQLRPCMLRRLQHTLTLAATLPGSGILSSSTFIPICSAPSLMA